MTKQQDTVGGRVRQLRLERGLSQRELTGTGVSTAYVSRIENGERVPSMKALRVLASRLAVSVDLLETGQALGGAARREFELADAELALRLGDGEGEAESTLREILGEAEAAGDVTGSRRARTLLGHAAAQRGQHLETIGLLRPLVESTDYSLADNPDVAATLARAYATIGPEGEGVRLLERTLDEVRSGGEANDPRFVRVATYLSYALVDAGDLPHARSTLAEALSRAGDHLDLFSSVRLYWAQARLAQVEDRHGDARSHIARAIALLELTEDSIQLGRAQLLYAESLLGEQRVEDAEASLAQAAAALAAVGETKDRAWLLTVQAEVANAAGEHERALEQASRAARMVDEDPELVGRALTIIGVALAAEGDLLEAVNTFERAESSLLTGDARFHYQLLESWSAVLETAGRLPEALAVARRAAAVADAARRGQPRPAANRPARASAVPAPRHR